MKYLVTVAGREIEVEVDGDQVTVAGTTRTATLRTVAGTASRQLVVDGRPAVIALRSSGRGQWTLGVSGDRWDAEVIDELFGCADRRSSRRERSHEEKGNEPSGRTEGFHAGGVMPPEQPACQRFVAALEQSDNVASAEPRFRLRLKRGYQRLRLLRNRTDQYSLS